MRRTAGDIGAHPFNRISRILAAAALSLLCACAGAPGGTDSGGPATAATAGASGEPQTPQSEPPQSESPQSESSVIPVAQPPDAETASAPAPPPQTAARVVRADELVGKKETEITELLGKPSLVRHDRQAQVWQYRGQTCVLDLFFYPPAENKNADSEQDGGRAVVYFEARGKDAEKVPGDRCISEIVAARAGAG